MARFRACGWTAESVDGHDPAAIDGAIARARTADKPSLIACRTRIGFGAPTKQDTAAAHGAPLGAAEIAATRAALGWPHPAVRGAGADPHGLANCRPARRRPPRRLAAPPGGAGPNGAGNFTRTQAGLLPADLDAVVSGLKRRFSDERPSWATRKCSQEVLEALTVAAPELLGGSADLTGSNNTKTAVTPPVGRDDFGARYVHYGVREHAMAAAMNGIALHGGLIPYGGTFLTFADYCRPAIRLSALMGIRVIYVMTHDSIGLGEDGPTHQPVEQLAALRAIPNLNVFRPADAIETAECWHLAVATTTTPSLLALTRQGVPTLRTTHTDENLCARGGYILAEAVGDRAATILATGSEVAIAMTARATLQAAGTPTTVVSLPCWTLFDKQDAAYRARVLGTAPRVAIEAAVPFGWCRYVDGDDAVIGLHGFGASAPAEALYEHFAITAEAVVGAVRARLG